MDNRFDVCVIGGGPAGMSAAIAAGGRGLKVALLERNEKLGKKLYISGKGRCNLTNNTGEKEFLEKVVTNPKFLYSAVYNFPPSATMELMEGAGLRLKTERGGRVFPESDKSSDVIKAFSRLLEKHRVKVFFNCRVSAVEFNENSGNNENDKSADGAGVYTVFCGGTAFQARSLILACGGVSYPLTGSDGDGFRFAESLGHSVAPLRPALVPLILSEDVAALAGLSLKNIAFSVYSGAKKIYSDFGEMLFTHQGISGPVVLSASSVISGRGGAGASCEVSIDLKPALTAEALDARLLRDFSEGFSRQFKNALDGLLPKSLIPFVIARSGIPPDKRLNQITREERENLTAILKNLRFKVAALGNIQEGIVTGGGVSVKEINPATMESRIRKNLYFAGEMLDTDAFTGGYNIQIAVSTGVLAGCCALKDGT